MTTTIIYIGSFIALLGVLVTIHEYGHFIFARIFKVHVQRFSIGMGPVIYKRLDKYGTEFAISALPLGGYVSMITNKLIEHEPELKEELTEEQITFDKIYEVIYRTFDAIPMSKNIDINTIYETDNQTRIEAKKVVKSIS